MEPVDIGIDDLLPHRGRMKLVDEILELAEGRARTRSIVTPAWPFFDGTSVNALILVELLAQTAGIHNGWTRILKNGLDSEKKGWLVGIKKAEFFMERIPLHTPVIAYAENHFEYDNFREVGGTAEINGVIAARATLQLFQPD